MMSQLGNVWKRSRDMMAKAMGKTAVACAVVAWGLGACVNREPLEPGRQAASILEGSAAPNFGAVVRVRHRDRVEVCTGTTIAERLVLTSLHCTLHSSATGDEPLPADGFRIAFGVNEERYEERYVTALSWIDAPNAVSIADVVADGEDVALMMLDSPAPPEVEPQGVSFDYLPSADDLLTAIGFGISSLETGESGTRLRGEVHVTGFDPATGVVQTEGAIPCFGDSGGPLLYGPENLVVGVIGQIGGSSAQMFCDTGLTFAMTVANARVRAFLGDACRDAGGCGPRPTPNADADAGVDEPPDDAGAETSVEAGARSDMLDSTVAASSGDASSAHASDGEAGCGCAVPGGRGSGSRSLALLAFALALRASRFSVTRRRRRRAQPFRHAALSDQRAVRHTSRSVRHAPTRD